MVAGTLLVDTVKETIYRWWVTRDLITLLWQKSLEWQVDPDALLRLLLIGGLGFIWGVAFKLAHSERGSVD